MNELKVPGAHKVGILEPVAHAEPAGHGVQSDASSRLRLLEYEPAKHGSSADAPGGQKYPALHSLHALEPAASWYSPPGQLMHFDALSWSLNVPAAHGVGSFVPTGQNVPIGQITQSSRLPRKPTAAITLWLAWVPPGQG